MFKLQLVLCLFLSVQLHTINGLQQLSATAELKNVNSTDTENSSNVNPEVSEFIEGDLLNPTAANSEKGNFIEHDLHNPTADVNRNAIQNMNAPNGQLSYSIESENNEIQDDENPEEGNYIEGDLLYPSGDLHHSSILTTGSSWPGGLVPYSLNGTFTQAEIRHLLYAFDQYSAKTCIKFYPRTTEVDYVSIVKPKAGCASYVGRIGGMQTLKLATNCFRHGTIMHELMHALGFLHEQNTYARDDYVKILYENLLPGHEKNFRKFSKKEVKNLGIPYDYGSIMHYVDNAFTKNGKRTIKALKKLPKGVRMGQRDGFSHHDLEKINRRYLCDNLNLNRK